MSAEERPDRPYRRVGGSVDAEAHASRASELLELIERQEDELGALLERDPERHLELIADGTIRRLNANREWSCELAQAHALTAIATELGYLAYLENLV